MYYWDKDALCPWFWDRQASMGQKNNGPCPTPYTKINTNVPIRGLNVKTGTVKILQEKKWVNFAFNMCIQFNDYSKYRCNKRK